MPLRFSLATLLCVSCMNSDTNYKNY